MTHFIFIGNIIGIHMIITYNSYPTMQGNSRTENRTNMKQPILRTLLYLFLSIHIQEYVAQSIILFESMYVI